MKRFFDLRTMKYPWLLTLAMLLAVLALYFDMLLSDTQQALVTAVYMADMALALLWSILNYMAQLKLRAVFKRCGGIEDFVAQLTMPRDEKEELRQYLTDFVRDLEAKGMHQSDAVQTAIAQFQVREFSEAQPGNLFEKPSHLYLIGCSAALLAAGIFGYFANRLAAGVFLLAAVSFALLVYGIALLFLFLLYKALDALILKQ